MCDLMTAQKHLFVRCIKSYYAHVCISTHVHNQAINIDGKLSFVGLYAACEKCMSVCVCMGMYGGKGM